MILSSNKKEAEPFKDFICEILLPELDKIYKEFNTKELLKTKQELSEKTEQLTETKEKLSKKDTQLSQKEVELEAANKKSLRIKKFINNAVINTIKQEWIYISTNDAYQHEKIYKIGSTQRLVNRIQNYKTSRAEDYYYIWVKPVYNSKDTEILEPLKFNSITKKIKNKTEEVVNIDDENRNLVIRELVNFLETIKNNSEISRKELLNILKIDLPKNYIWSCIKEYTKWFTSNTLLTYKEKNYYINY